MFHQTDRVLGRQSGLHRSTSPHPPRLKTAPLELDWYFSDRTFCQNNTVLSMFSVCEECLRIVLKYQRLMSMDLKNQRKLTDEWICQRILKWISSSHVSLCFENWAWNTETTCEKNIYHFLSHFSCWACCFEYFPAVLHGKDWHVKGIESVFLSSLR